MWRNVVAAFLIAASTAGNLAGQHVHGRLREAGSGMAVMAASLSLLDSAGARRPVAVTDSVGRFRFDAAPGRYQLEVERIGYQTVRSDTIRLAEHDSLEIDLQVTPDAVRLEPVVAAALAGTRLDQFHDHRRRFEKLGIGDFFGRSELEPWINHSVSAVLQSVPYLNSSLGRAGRLGSRSRRCSINYYVDGVRLRSLFGQSIDDMLRVVDLEGIEVYRGQSHLPAEYSDPQGRGCPVVAFWTRRSS